MQNPRVHSRWYSSVCLGLLVSILSVTLAAHPQAPPSLFRQGPTVDPNTGRRTLVLMFDFTSQPTEPVQRAVAEGLRWVDETMTDRDRVAIVAVDARVRFVSDFTSNRDDVRMALRSASDAAATGAGTLANSPVPNTAQDAGDDVRLRGIAIVCETLRAIPERKSILYFSNGLSGMGDIAQLRSATTTCNRADVSIYPVDARGLQATNATGVPAK